MSLSVASVPALLGGISQQPPHVRSSDQLEDMKNGWASLALGLQNRAPSNHVARIMTGDVSDAHIHEINRDETEQYVAVTSDGSIRVFDLNGVEQSVSAPDGWGYLDGVSKFADDIEMCTVADHTFVVNKRKTVAMDVLGADRAPDPVYFRWVSRAAEDINGDPYQPGSAGQYPVNPAEGTLTGTVDRYDKLPPVKEGDPAPAQGAIYKIASSLVGAAYYVRRVGAAWEECNLPGLRNAIDARTMPHALVRDEDGTFVFAPFSWAPRRLGDTVQNPAPGFVGRTINDVFFYQNRLAFLHDESVTLSRVGDFGNFFRMTMQDLLDDDVTSMAASTTGVAVLADVAVFSDGMLLTSAQNQFSMTNGEAGVTHSSVAIRGTTSYRMNVRAGLCPCGSEVYFASEGNGFARVHEYVRMAGADTTSAGEITAHVPNLIPSGVHKIVAANDMNALFVLTDGRPSSVFVYQFYWSSNDAKLQTAWHEWTFDAPILSAAYLAGYLFLVVRRPGGVFLERIDLQPSAHPAATTHQVHLDRQATITGTYDPVADRTTFLLPYSPVQAGFRMVRGNDFTARPESLIDPTSMTWLAHNEVRVPGNEALGPVVVGNRFEFSFQLSEQIFRTPDGTARTSGRYQLRTIFLDYRNTAYFKVHVTASGQTNDQIVIPAMVREMTGKTVGSSALILNRPAYDNGTYRAQVYSQSTTGRLRVSNDTHVGCTFISAQVEGEYWNRSSIR
ncbi:MAG: hypothetical protein ACK4UQ_06600 [Brevundimonas sp.]